MDGRGRVHLHFTTIESVANSAGLDVGDYRSLERIGEAAK
jgi:hypothetical protein